MHATIIGKRLGSGGENGFSAAQGARHIVAHSKFLFEGK